MLYLDTENNFAPDRLQQIAERFSQDPAFVLDNVRCAPIWNEDMFPETLRLAKQMISEEQVRLVIIDSIMGVFRFEYAGRGELSERQQKLGQIVYSIKKMAAEYNIAVLMTNQMTADPVRLYIYTTQLPSALASIAQPRSPTAYSVISSATALFSARYQALL